MERALYRLLNQERRREITLRGETVQMVLLTARALLALRLEAERAEDAYTQALCGNAALIAQCLRRDGEAVFASGDEVLDSLSVEEINSIVARYRQWSAQIDPAYGSDGESIEAIKKA